MRWAGLIGPPSSCSPLSRSVEYGAQAAGMQQLDVDGPVYLKLLGVVIGPLPGPLGGGNGKGFLFAQHVFNHSAPSVTLRYFGITQDDCDSATLNLNI